MAEREFSAESGSERVKVETEIVKCAGCGANMIFDADLQTLYCPHCGSKKNIDGVKTAQEKDIMDGLSADSVFYDDADNGILPFSQDSSDHAPKSLYSIPLSLRCCISICLY